MPLLHGIFGSSNGACPVCGSNVRRLHSFDGARLQDTYGCYRCGPTAYTSRAFV